MGGGGMRNMLYQWPTWFCKAELGLGLGWAHSVFSAKITHTCTTDYHCEAHSHLHSEHEAHSHLHYECEAHSQLHYMVWGHSHLHYVVWGHIYIMTVSLLNNPEIGYMCRNTGMCSDCFLHDICLCF